MKFNLIQGEFYFILAFFRGHHLLKMLSMVLRHAAVAATYTMRVKGI